MSQPPIEFTSDALEHEAELQDEMAIGVVKENVPQWAEQFRRRARMLRQAAATLRRLERIETAARQMEHDLNEGDLSDCCYGGSCVAGQVSDRLTAALKE